MTKKDWDSKEVFLSNSFFKQLYEKSPDAIVLLDNSNKVMHANMAFTKMFQYEISEITGRNIDSLIVPNGLLHESERMTITALNKEIVRTETKRSRKDGTPLWVSVIGLPIMTETDTVGIFVVYTDISKEVEIKEKAEEASRTKSAILANMSHEFRTPMSAILGFSDILKDELQDAEHISMIKDIHTSAKRLLNTLNSVLELAHLESTDFIPVIKNVDICHLILEMSKTFKAIARNKNLALVVEFGEEKCSAKIDEDAFRQVVSKVFDNAIKYTHKGSITLRVSTETRNNRVWCVISISDTGIGISKEKHTLIFKEFRQVSEGMSRSYEGTGLGLTLAQKMIEMMNGKIELESELGTGSTFKIYLPVESRSLIEKTIMDISKDTEKRQNNIAGKKSLLLVEDNKTNKVLVKRFLRDHFTVSEASNGSESIMLAGKNRFDVILMDINLGTGMNGIQTITEIRKNPFYKNSTIIAVTGYALAGEREKILSAGFSGYISKPFTKEQLLDTLL
jgi:PAS domain S-box-containing protein